MGLLSSVTNSIGGFLNGITGANSASKKSQKYSLQSMAVQNAYEKEAAQNAHQWEVKDLEAAGLNPILSAGGNGAQADTGISAGSQQSAGITPLDLLQSLTSAGKNMKGIQQIEAESNLANSQAAKNWKEVPGVTDEQASRIGKNLAETEMLKSQKTLNSAKTVESEANAKYQNERARGFSESTTKSGSAGATIGGKKLKLGSGNISGTYSHSKTW